MVVLYRSMLPGACGQASSAMIVKESRPSQPQEGTLVTGVSESSDKIGYIRLVDDRD